MDLIVIKNNMEKEYKITWCENKSPDWKIATLEDETGQMNDVSINRVNKKGEAFPDFDGIIPTATVKGNLWTSSAGKRYLFAPKPVGTQIRRSPSAINQAMEKKEASISKFQDTKELSIKTSSTARMACDMVVATLRGEEIIDESVIKGKLEMWRKWFFMHWDDPENYPPFE